MRREIAKHVREEMERHRDITSRQAAATREVFEQQQEKVSTWLERIRQQITSTHLQIILPQPKADDARAFIEMLSGINFKSKSSLRLHAESLLQSVLTLENTRLWLDRLHGVYDGSVPSVSISAACLKHIFRSGRLQWKASKARLLQSCWVLSKPRAETGKRCRLWASRYPIHGCKWARCYGSSRRWILSATLCFR